jgi:hypothetical protein
MHSFDIKRERALTMTSQQESGWQTCLTWDDPSTGIS